MRPGPQFLRPSKGLQRGVAGGVPCVEPVPTDPSAPALPQHGDHGGTVPGLVQCLWGPLTPSLALPLGLPRWGNQGTW